jgi:hypothetical protein
VDTYTKLHTDWFTHSEVDGGRLHTHARQHEDRISLLSFFQSKEIELINPSRLKKNCELGISSTSTND